MNTKDTAEDDVSFEVGKRDDNTLWHVSVMCKGGISQDEFAAALISLGEDILKGKVDFDTAPDAVGHDQH